MTIWCNLCSSCSGRPQQFYAPRFDVGLILEYDKPLQVQQSTRAGKMNNEICMIESSSPSLHVVPTFIYESKISRKVFSMK